MLTSNLILPYFRHVVYLYSVILAISIGHRIFHLFILGDYIDPVIVSDFEKQHNAKINFVYFETDDHRDNIMAESKGRGFDLILLSKLMAQHYINLG